MARLIEACEFLDLGIIKAQYNAFHDGPDDDVANAEKGGRLVTSNLALEGMSCAACVSSIENAVSNLDGVERVSVSLTLSCGTIVHNELQVSLDAVIAAIESHGYGAKARARTATENLELLQHNDEIQHLRKAFIDAAFMSSFLSGLEAMLWFDVPAVATVCIQLAAAAIAIWVQAFDAIVIHRNAWRRGIPASLTMDSLVSISLILGMVLSGFNIILFGLDMAKVYWSSVSFLATVILGGRLLDVILRKQSTATFAQLYQLQEQSLSAKLIRSPAKVIDQEQVVDAAALTPRDEIRIAPGSIVPCDCYILDGESFVDQSTMTGESAPVLKKPGDSLMAGTSNLSYDLTAIVLKPQEDSSLEDLIASISGATENSGSGKEIDIMISRFAGIILLLTAVCFTRTLTIQWSEVDFYLAVNAGCERAMAILASACPCALGLATPTAVIAGLDAARLRGIIVKGGFQTLQAISGLTHFVLDKTGTLTTGQLSVSNTDGHLCDIFRTLICIAERDEAQTHPIARALFKWTFSSLTEEQRRLVNEARLCKTTDDFGNGVTCEIRLQSGEKWYTTHVGNERFLRQNQVEIHDCQSQPDQADDHTLVHVAIDKQYVGRLHLRDTVRPNAASVISHLRDQFGLQIAMLTGDVESEARRVSKMLQIEVLSSHSLPREKQAFVQHIRERSSYNCVGMMGDGLNDAPALSTADVGITLSLGSKRPGAAISEATNSQVADVIFRSPDLSRLPELLEIARKTIRQSTWNLWWAIAYNVIAVSLAMGIAEPFGVAIDAARAGTMMALSSISVLAWSMWLRYGLSKIQFDPSNSK